MHELRRSVAALLRASGIGLAVLVGNGAAGYGQNAPGYPAAQSPPGAVYLDQGWGYDTAAWWYHISQGTAFMPYQWFMSLEQAGGDALPLSAEGVTSSHVRWTPDGKYISFLSARDGGKAQVWLLDRRGGEAVRLTDTVQGVDDFEWSPDSTRLVLILRDPKAEDLETAKNKEKPAPATPPKPKTPPPFVIDRLQFKRDTVGYLDRRRAHLYVFDIGSKKATQITSGDFDDNEPAWSPDSKSLAFSSNRSPDPDANYQAHIWVVAADNTDKGAHVTQVSPNPGPDQPGLPMASGSLTSLSLTRNCSTTTRVTWRLFPQRVGRQTFSRGLLTAAFTARVSPPMVARFTS